METKICSKCKVEREVCEFRVDKSKKDGLYPSCKKCCSELRLSKRDHHIQRSKEWYDENSEEVNKKRYQKIKIDDNKVRKMKESQKVWEKNNRQKRNEYAVEKRKSDPLRKLSENVRTRIRVFLKNKNINKKNNTRELVGCDTLSLKEYIEKQFKDGMTWENQGKYGWHIDHIIPLSSAKNEEEIYKLCHYTNLQPLWAVDNLKKNNKIIDYSNFSPSDAIIK